jgi:hypothetical protein
MISLSMARLMSEKRQLMPGLHSGVVGHKSCGPWEGCNMVDTYESLNERFPILDVVIKHLDYNDAEKKLIKELFVTVYGVGYNDGQAHR